MQCRKFVNVTDNDPAKQITCLYSSQKIRQFMFNNLIKVARVCVCVCSLPISRLLFVRSDVNMPMKEWFQSTTRRGNCDILTSSLGIPMSYK